MQRGVVAMFCPECDRVYLKTEVCPHCGVKLQRATGKPEKAIPSKKALSARATKEIRCPECGSTNYKSESFLAKSARAIDSNTSLVISLLHCIAILCFWVRGELFGYRCHDCGCRWSEK